jgi:hypothetical protein
MSLTTSAVKIVNLTVDIFTCLSVAVFRLCTFIGSFFFFCSRVIFMAFVKIAPSTSLLHCQK